MRYKNIDHIGVKYHFLTVIKKDFKNKFGHWNYIFMCDCGKIKSIAISNVTKKKGRVVKSCGCYNINSKIKHNMSYTRFYKRFFDITSRCNNTNNTSYLDYGGRGIKIEWNSFDEFKNDMYESYCEHIKIHGCKQTSIDRINNNGNYSKENCRWATYKVQANNRRHRSKNKIFLSNIRDI